MPSSLKYSQAKPKPRKSNNNNHNPNHNHNIDKHSQILAPINSIPDKWKLVSTYVKTRGLVKQHIESFNYFVDKGLKKILKVIYPPSFHQNKFPLQIPQNTPKKKQ